MSAAVSTLMVTHLNAGARYTPSARNASGDRADVWKYTLGGSEILAISPTFNLMLETLWSREGDVVGAGKTRMSSSWTISPGARMALNTNQARVLIWERLRNAPSRQSLATRMTLSRHFLESAAARISPA